MYMYVMPFLPNDLNHSYSVSEQRWIDVFIGITIGITKDG